MSTLPEELGILLQAVVALVLGGLLGWERESAGKWAGFRTHMLVCLSATLLARLGQVLIVTTAEQMPDEDVLRADPMRIIEAIITGVAFLGAGTIFRDRHAERMRGLTTAASLLSVACIGIAVAIDRYVIAVGVTLLGLFVMHTLRHLEQRTTAKKSSHP